MPTPKVEDKVVAAKHGEKLNFHVDPSHITPKHILKSVADSGRYVIRTTLKVMGYMLPATAFFFVSRTPQTKVRGIVIDVDKGVLGRDVLRDKANFAKYAALYPDGEGGIDFMQVPFKDKQFKPVKPGTLLSKDINEENIAGGKKLYYREVYNNTETPHYTTEYPFTHNPRDANNGNYFKNAGVKEPWYGKSSNSIGALCYNWGTSVNNGLQKAANFFNRKIGSTTGTQLKLDNEKTERFARTFVNASIAYTPYFMMKTDVLSAEWDTNRMDMGIDRALKGISHLNWGEFRTGLSEVSRSAMREPFTDPKREEAAQKARWGLDPEHKSNEAFQLQGRFNPHTLETQAGQKLYATEALKAKPVTPATLTQLKKPSTNWAAQEAVRKFQDTNDQGQSIH